MSLSVRFKKSTGMTLYSMLCTMFNINIALSSSVFFVTTTLNHKHGFIHLLCRAWILAMNSDSTIWPRMDPAHKLPGRIEEYIQYGSMLAPWLWKQSGLLMPTSKLILRSTGNFTSLLPDRIQLFHLPLLFQCCRQPSQALHRHSWMLRRRSMQSYVMVFLLAMAPLISCDSVENLYLSPSQSGLLMAIALVLFLTRPDPLSCFCTAITMSRSNSTFWTSLACSWSCGRLGDRGHPWVGARLSSELPEASPLSPDTNSWGPWAPKLAGVPQEYHDLCQVFSKTKATSLLPHQPYDCDIDILLWTMPPKGVTLLAIRTWTYISKSLAAGIICRSSSPAGDGFFFVKKKDKSLCRCIDYRGVNDITVNMLAPWPSPPTPWPSPPAPWPSPP